MDVTLVMFKADGARRDFPLSKSRNIVGRKNTCDLRIPLSSVSRQHCELLIEDDQIHLRDLGSSNGTYHNSNRVQEATLAAGDKVIIGPVVFTVVVDGEPGEIQPIPTLLSEEESEEAGQSPTVPSDAAAAQSLEASDSEMPSEVEADPHTPTVDLDDDPIAALEALANAEGDDEDDEDDDDMEFEFLMDDDDDK